MSQSTSLMNQFLIAMPAMDNPYFDHTVTYICEHSNDGAMGFVINRPIGFSIEELFKQIDIPYQKNSPQIHHEVFFGGPVEQERGFVLHTGPAEWSASMPVTQQLSITTSFDILEAIGQDEGPENFLMVLGYAGWGANQLEEEILENAWLSTPASQELIFKTDCSDTWQQAAQLLGVDLNMLSSQAGHA